MINGVSILDKKRMLIPLSIQASRFLGTTKTVHNKYLLGGGGICPVFLFFCLFVFNVSRYRALLNILILYFELQWYAICLSDVGDYEGIKVKIGNAFIIKEHFEVI